MEKIIFIIFAIACSTSINAQSINIKAIPFNMLFENKVTEYKVISENEIQFTSPAKSDLFHSSDGKYKTNKSPRLLFSPDSSFILSAKITIDFHANWDAGDLVIYNDTLHWTKFCFERDHQEQARVVSVVCNGFADDCNSMKVPNNEVYYKIAGNVNDNKFALYYSNNGIDWFLIRSFGLNKRDNLRIGFSVQSPVGNGATATFSDIKYKDKHPENWWTGE